MFKSKAKIIGIIPARYGSKRFPGKPLALICGKSLIQRTYENCIESKCFDVVIVATDDQRIFDHVQGFGGQVVMTPTECPTGTDRIYEVLLLNLKYQSAEIVVNIQGDEPCVDHSIFFQLIHALHKDSQAVMSTPIVPIQDENQLKNPFQVKCVIDLQGNALYFSRALIPHGKEGYKSNIQYYGHVGIYAYRQSFLETYVSLPISPLQHAEDLEQLKILENGYRIKTVTVNEAPLGVDHPEDIKKVELYLCKQSSSSSQAESAPL